jgi:hypothetical protein
MLKTTLEVTCDKCDASIVVPPGVTARTDTTPAWKFNSFSEEYEGDVVITNVQRWLQDVNWMVDLDWEPIVECPSCKEVE